MTVSLGGGLCSLHALLVYILILKNPMKTDSEFILLNIVCAVIIMIMSPGHRGLNLNVHVDN